MKIARKQSVAMALQPNDIVFANDCYALIVQVCSRRRYDYTTNINCMYETVENEIIVSRDEDMMK